MAAQGTHAELLRTRARYQAVLAALAAVPDVHSEAVAGLDTEVDA